MSEFEEGERVRLSNVHHMHNARLKRCKGGEATVVKAPSECGYKYQVEFDQQTGKLTDRFWVAPQWLEAISND